MASWMVHLRIADKLLTAIPNLCPTEFVVGNIAPDSGVPNEDWSAFTPSTVVSHFKSEKVVGKNNIDIPAFISRYFTPTHQTSYNNSQYSFFLGYLIHLLTDILWVEKIYAPSRIRFQEDYKTYRENFIWKVKEDWYDLDYLYLKRNPNFRAFEIYEKAVGFENTFMEEFSRDAFDNRREYIVGFYHEPKYNLEREYTYLTEAEAERFVTGSAKEILGMLNTKYCVK